jgi:DNA-binding MarR family transcriptional regulator
VDAVRLLFNRLCHLVVEIESALEGVSGTREGARWELDTPRLGALLSIDIFGPQRPGSIGELTGMSSGGTTKLVTRLEEAGLVTRSSGEVPGDRRAVIVSITDEGRTALRAFERIVVGLAPALLSAFDEVLEPASQPDPLAPAEAPTVAEPLLSQLFRFVALADASIWEVVGDIDILQPTDPRGVLVLNELDLRGELRAGDVPLLVGRSRAVAGALVDELVALGLVARGRDTDDHRVVTLDLTPVGRALSRGLVAAFAVEVPSLRPIMAALALELRKALLQAS